MPTSKNIITRFAPSPTGFLHIGGARTALFNWLYAKHTNGKMLLRIEDTDKQRSTKAAIDAIIAGLNWLGITADEEPIFQSERENRHREIAQQLVEKGQAYYCYGNPEELPESKENNSKATNFSQPHDRRWRDSTETPPSGVKPAVRIKTPTEGFITLHDKVLGEIKFPYADLEDFVLLRSDGTPTYMLAVVVDDHDMGVTHIVRGDDHLTNAAKQMILYNAMGWEIPTMAHIPLILGEDGAKLSKRHGALGVTEYQKMGYLPEALKNYLVRLGWSHGDDEIMSTEQLIKWFEIEDINKSASRFDFKKLDAINSHYLKNMADDELLQEVLALLQIVDNGSIIKDNLTETNISKLLTAMPALKERAKNLLDIIDSAEFIFQQQEVTLTEKAKEMLQTFDKKIFQDLAELFSEVQQWDKANLEVVIKSYLEQQNLKLGKVGPFMRIALTGDSNSIGLYDLLSILGKDEVIARLKKQVN